MGKVITVASSKGGVGKSTVSTNLAIDLANRGLKIMLVDAENDGTTRDYDNALSGRLDVINGYDVTFPKMLEMYAKNYDFIVVDTAGVNADMENGRNENLQEEINKRIFNRSDLILVPIEPSPETIRKTIRFSHTVEMYIDASRGKLQALAFLNMYIKNEILSQDIDDLLNTEGTIKIPMSNTKIIRATAMKQAGASFQSVNEYSPNSEVAKNMTDLINETLNLLK